MNYTQEQQSALVEASRDRLRFPERIGIRLLIDGEDYTRFLENDWEYGNDDGIAVVLDATLATPLPLNLEGRELQLSFEIDGVELPGFVGEIVTIDVAGQYSDILAATAGYHAERTPLGDGPEDDYELFGAEPSTALYEALLRLSYLGYEIPRVKEPKLDRVDDEAFDWTDFVKDVVDACEGDNVLKAADWPTNVASCYTLGTIAEDAVWDFEEGRDTEYGGIKAETVDDERYSAVQVYRTGDIENAPLTKPVKIDNRGRNVPERSVLLLEYTAEDEENGESPYRMAFDEAERRSKNEATVTIDAAYPVFFLTRGQVVTAAKREILADEERIYRYRVRLGSIPVSRTGGSLAGEGELLGTETRKIEHPSFEVPSGFAKPLWGYDTDAVPYFDTTLPWVTLSGEELELDTVVAASYGVSISEESGEVVVAW